MDCGHSRVVCKKEGIHPPFFPEAKVYCNGELVMTTGGTKEEYVVDVWSGKQFCTVFTVRSHLAHILYGLSDCEKRGLLLFLHVD